MEVDSAEYKAEYDKAVAALDEAEKTSTTPRDDAGRFTKVEAEVKTEPKVEAPVAAPDPLEELRARLEKAEKIARDNQAWGTKNAQELAALKAEREEQARNAQKPKILETNPDLADAIRFVASEPVRQSANPWQDAITKVHPDVLSAEFPSTNPELYQSLVARRAELGAAWDDPYTVIREINEQKAAHKERQSEQAIGKRFAAEAAKLAQKSAMSVPGAGGSSVSAVSTQDDVDRIRKMSDAEFAREVAKVKGY